MTGDTGASAAAAVAAPRLRLLPLFKRLLWTLIVPIALALVVDWLLGTLPWVTLVAALICIPLASLVVGKAVLQDFERILAIVAPPPAPEAQAEQAGEHRPMDAGADSAASEPAGAAPPEAVAPQRS